MISEIRCNNVAAMQNLQAMSQTAAPKEQAETESVSRNLSDSADVRPQTKLDKMLGLTAAKAAELEQNMEPHVEGQVIIKTKGSLFQNSSSILKDYGAKLICKFDMPQNLCQGLSGDLMQIQLPEGITTAQAMAAMMEDPNIAYVVPNTIYTLDDPQPESDNVGGGVNSSGEGKRPNDLKEDLWGLDNHGQQGGKVDADIDAPEAWQKTTGLANGQGPIIAVIDTGVDYNHPDLKNNIWTNPGEIPGNGSDDDGDGVIDDVHGYNAFDDNGDPMDAHSHGTHCAGTIAAEGNNDMGVVGVNWKATIMPIKIFGDDGRTNAAAIIRGINYATKHGARITSNSWGGGLPNQAIKEAFEASSALHIMAAGNSSQNNDLDPHYPSSYRVRNSIAVASTDRQDNLSYFSCYGKTSVDIGAPGSDILSTVPGGGYGVKSGTSMATPHVTGAAGLLLAMDPTMSNEEIKTRLLEGSDKIDSLTDKVVSGGRLNVNKAMEFDYQGFIAKK